VRHPRSHGELLPERSNLLNAADSESNVAVMTGKPLFDGRVNVFADDGTARTNVQVNDERLVGGVVGAETNEHPFSGHGVFGKVALSRQGCRIEQYVSQLLQAVGKKRESRQAAGR
jgi:hypothetical protein